LGKSRGGGGERSGKGTLKQDKLEIEIDQKTIVSSKEPKKKDLRKGEKSPGGGEKAAHLCAGKDSKKVRGIRGGGGGREGVKFTPNNHPFL